MLKKLKPVLFFVLAAVFVILLVVPAPVRSDLYTGVSAEGEYGPTCYCPVPIIFNCLCNVFPI